MENLHHQEQHKFYRSNLFENRFLEPIDAEYEMPIDTGKPSSPFIARPKILLVEDSLMLQTLHIEMLSLIGCKVDLAEDGHEAVAMASKKAYDVIFMDVGLPRMDGITATKAIRSQELKYHRNVIIALTTHSIEIEKECRDAGIDDFYPKPIHADMLMNILKFWLPDLLIRNYGSLN